MKTLLAAAAALSLLAGSALAQTPLNCGSGSLPAPTQGTGPGASGGQASSGQSPSGATCETVVHSNGTMTVKNGPNADDPGLSSATHEGSGSPAGAAAH
jgi:hypothetical protein